MIDKTDKYGILTKKGYAMLVQNKIEIQLTVEDVQNIIYEHFRKGYGDGDYSFNFKVVNRPYASGIYDTCDRHEFDGIKMVITK